MCKNHFHTSVQILRSENGSEFFSHSAIEFLANLGITHQSSCPYTPQQNGRVERKHKHLLEITRALRFQANLPKSFWGYCLLTATFLINRLPTPVLQNKIPYELLYSKPPDYSILKTFGCLCYASIHSQDKLDSRAIPTIFSGILSYPKGL